MKKIVIILLTVIMVVGMSACGKSNNEKKENNNGSISQNYSQEELENAINQAELDEKTEKYSTSEYEKISVKAVSSDRLEHLKKYVKYDLTGSREVNWNAELDTVVDFYIPKEIFNEVSYSEDGSEAYVKILVSTEGFGNASNKADVFPMTLTLSVECEGYFDNGSYTDKEDAIESFQEQYERLVNYKYTGSSETVNGEWREYTVEILSDLESNGSRGVIKTIYSKIEEGKYYPYEVCGWYREVLSDKYTADMFLSALNDENTEAYNIEFEVANIVEEYNPEIMYEIFNIIKIDYVETE